MSLNLSSLHVGDVVYLPSDANNFFTVVDFDVVQNTISIIWLTNDKTLEMWAGAPAQAFKKKN